jgi:fructose-specific phosphotransferase system component IIB
VTLLVVVAAVAVGIALDVLAEEQIHAASEPPRFWVAVEKWAIPLAAGIVALTLAVAVAS